MKSIMFLCFLHLALFSATITDSVRISHSGKVTITRTVECGDSANLAFYFKDLATDAVECSTALAESFGTVIIQNTVVTAKRTVPPKDRKQFLHGDANNLSFNLIDFLELPEMNLIELTSYKRVTSDNQEDIILYAEKIASGAGWELVITLPTTPLRIWGKPNQAKMKTATVELLSEQDLDDPSITWTRIPQIVTSLIYLAFVMILLGMIGKLHRAHRDSHS